MKTKYKILFGIPAVIACMLFGCTKREDISFIDLTAVKEETKQVEVIQDTAEEIQETAEVTGGAADKAEELQKEAAPVQDDKEEILVIHICGAVNVPGVYELPVGSRIYQAVEAAGGFSSEAEADFLNQAQNLKDGSRIYVPTKEEAMLAGETLDFIGVDTNNDTQEEENGDNGLVNINTASREELNTLPGIGSGKAESIISYRTENGSFRTIEEIMNVEGIKEGLFQKIKNQITV